MSPWTTIMQQCVWISMTMTMHEMRQSGEMKRCSSFVPYFRQEGINLKEEMASPFNMKATYWAWKILGLPFEIDEPEERGWKLWSWIQYTCRICSWFRKSLRRRGRILNFKTNGKRVDERKRKRDAFADAPKILYCSLKGHWGEKQKTSGSPSFASPIINFPSTVLLHPLGHEGKLLLYCLLSRFPFHQQACGETTLAQRMSLSHSVTERWWSQRSRWNRSISGRLFIHLSAASLLSSSSSYSTPSYNNLRMTPESLWSEQDNFTCKSIFPVWEVWEMGFPVSTKKVYRSAFTPGNTNSNSNSCKEVFNYNQSSFSKKQWVTVFCTVHRLYRVKYRDNALKPFLFLWPECDKVTAFVLQQL